MKSMKKMLALSSMLAIAATTVFAGTMTASADDPLHLTFYYPVNVGGDAAKLIE